MRSAISLILGIGLISVLGVAFLLHSKNASAAVTHVVISQVQISGTTAGDEFVELYNPTPSDIDLTHWRLARINSGGTSGNLVASLSGSIKSHGYFLIAPNAYTGSVSRDLGYSTGNSIANNNAVVLFSDSGTTTVDLVGIGPGATSSESAAASTPSSGGSIQRKLDDMLGHGLDTDNNSSDFESLAISTPRNSSSIALTPTPSQEPSVSPTETPVPTPTPTIEPSPTPTVEPTSTPTPSAEPTATPTTEPSPTTAPSPTPTVAPSPAISPTPTTMPSPTPTPGGKVIFTGPNFVCTVHFQSWKLFNKTFFFPFVVCVKT